MARISVLGPVILGKIEPLDKEWQASRKKEMWWEPSNLKDPERFHQLYGKCPDDIYQDFLDLEEELLCFGGYSVVLPDIEEDANAILTRGYLRNGQSRMMVGRPSQCHANTADLWEQNQKDHDVTICTGYALSPDGLWRQHSWLLHRYDTGKQRRERVIETTVKRLAYFGFELTQQEAELFASQQAWS